MQRFVQLRHYAIFLLLFIVPIIAFTLIAFTISYFHLPIGNNWALFLNIFVINWYLWLYAIGVYLHNKLPPLIHIGSRHFKFLIHIIFGCFFLTTCALSEIFYTSFIYNKTIYDIIGSILMVADIISFCCIFYCFYFVSECLNIIRYQRLVSFSECIGDLFLLIFLPFGIWVLQPKINKVFADEQYELGSGIPAQQ